MVRPARAGRNSPTAATRPLKRPAIDAPVDAWAAFVYQRDNPAGPHDELWFHGAGCRQWFRVRRDTRTHEILATARRAARRARRDAVVSSRRAAASSTVRAGSRSSSTARGTKAIPATRSPRRCSPTASIFVARSFKYHRPRGIFTRRQRGAECARATRARRAHRAQRARDDRRALRRPRRREPEPLAVARLRRRRDQRRAVALPARGLLLQDVHVAAVAARVAPLRARHPRRRRHGPRGDGARSRPLRASIRALRRADRRRRAAGLAAARARRRDRRARDRLRRRLALRRQPDRRRRDDRRRQRTRWIADACASSRRTPTSRCSRVRRPSAGTTATWSDSSSASPIISRRRRRTCRGSGCGKSARATIVLAAGAHERPIAYANNDLPGTMLAGAARTYVKRYAVRPGSRAVIFTTNDSAYATALALHDADVAIAAIVDARPEAQITGTLPQHARALGLPIVAASAIVGAHGGKRVTAVDIAPLAGGATTLARLRSRLRLRRLESGGASVFAGARHAALRRRAGRARAAIVAAADSRRRRRERTLRSCRCARRRARGRTAAARGTASTRRLERRRGTGTRARADALWSVPARKPRRQVLRRPAGRCHRRRHRARRARGLHVGRASEALHDARHGHRPGQDEQRRRPCAARRSDRPRRSPRSARRRSARRTRP